MFWLLLLGWMVLNGRVDGEILVSGGLMAGGLALLCRRVLGLDPWGGVRLLCTLPKVFFYVGYLVGQVALANVQVARRILALKGKQSGGRMVWFDSGLVRPGHRLLLANSITLTPGTVTLATREGKLWVYALDGAFAAGVKDSGFQKRLARWEGQDAGTN